MRDYYAARAPEYDEIYAKPERQADLREIEAWLPLRFRGASVLEVACGTGYWTARIAREASSVFALDAAAETLEIARSRVADGRVEFQVGDAYALPRRAPKPDAAFAGFWLSHVPTTRVREFLEGLHAALSPGARVVFLDNLYVEGSSSPVAETDAEGNAYQDRRLRDGATHRVLKNFPTEPQLRAAVEGLAEEVRYRTWTYYWALEYSTKAFR
jgi:demethylmenaquinone methyltransferase/2-methoxy-6-polyprenyl-1,4-benzoquinol methylase